jgi:hypothetical protein
MAFARTIVEQREVTALIDTECDEWPRLRELYDGLLWRLARQPTVGYPVPETNPPLFLVHSRDWKRQGLPVIVLAYTYTADRVFIQAVRVLASAIDESEFVL